MTLDGRALIALIDRLAVRRACALARRAAGVDRRRAGTRRAGHDRRRADDPGLPRRPARPVAGRRELMAALGPLSQRLDAVTAKLTAADRRRPPHRCRVSARGRDGGRGRVDGAYGLGRRPEIG
jgi:hypothetical protein